MVERTQKVLSELHDLVAGAKGVPMSASCMISRADALALVERANAALVEDLAEAQRVTATSLETLERAQVEARQIVAAAEEKAKYLATQQPVHEEARRKAALVEAKAAGFETARAGFLPLDPQAPLARGYGLVRVRRTGRFLRHPGEVAAGDGLDITVAGGQVGARVEGDEAGAGSEAAPGQDRPARRPARS